MATVTALKQFILKEKKLWEGEERQKVPMANELKSPCLLDIFCSLNDTFLGAKEEPFISQR